MVRHTGFLTSIAAVVLAAFSVSVLERRSDGSSKTTRDDSVGTVFQASRLDGFPGHSFSGSEDSSQHAKILPGTTMRFRVPENSLVIVGSLDVSGAAHTLSISATADGGKTTDEAGSSPQFGDLEYMDMVSLSDLRQRFHDESPCQSGYAVPEDSKECGRQIVAHALNDKPSRRFLIPHFDFDQVVQHPSEASLIAEGSRVKVYMDLCCADGKSDPLRQHQMRAEAQRVCSTIERILLPLIERWIGRISDLDGDQHLSVVLTDLDRRESSVDTPILGCVRRGDFNDDDQNSLAGDIVYLDRRLPHRDQLHALLAHELTHAAIYCIRHEAPNGSSLKNHSVPSWLNEAAAHWVERQFCRTPSGYEMRQAAFRHRPSMCPIILKDDDHHQPARRSGSRVAGFTFLQQHLSDVSDLRELLEQCTPFEQSISVVTEAPFSRLFREWSIRQAVGERDECSPLESTFSCCSLTTIGSDLVRRKLHGTAFLTLYSEADQSVSIQSHPEARLQITVVHQVKTLNTQRCSDIPTVAHLLTADLANRPHGTIR